MIISCEKCNKKFNISDNLISEEGRLLQCGSCNHKWFYKLQTQSINLEYDNSNYLKKNITIEDKKKVNIDTQIENKIPTKTSKKKIIKNTRSLGKSSNLLKISIVFFISLIALIILIDTFKSQLEYYIPGINFILNNLYETLKDLFLFSNDLIN